MCHKEFVYHGHCGHNFVKDTLCADMEALDLAFPNLLLCQNYTQSRTDKDNYCGVGGIVCRNNPDAPIIGVALRDYQQACGTIAQANQLQAQGVNVDQARLQAAQTERTAAYNIIRGYANARRAAMQQQQQQQPQPAVNTNTQAAVASSSRAPASQAESSSDALRRSTRLGGNVNYAAQQAYTTPPVNTGSQQAARPSSSLRNMIQNYGERSQTITQPSLDLQNSLLNSPVNLNFPQQAAPTAQMLKDPFVDTHQQTSRRPAHGTNCATHRAI
jgi:hypothetical protein